MTERPEDATLVFPRADIRSWIHGDRRITTPIDQAIHKPTDLAIQRRAANLFVLVRLFTRFLLPIGLMGIAMGISLFFARVNYWPMVILSGAAVVLTALLGSMMAGAKFVAADEAAGIPVPDEALYGVLRTQNEFSNIFRALETQFVPEVNRRLRAALPKIRKLNGYYSERMYWMRLYWLAGNRQSWLLLTDEVTEIGEEVRVLRKWIFNP